MTTQPKPKRSGRALPLAVAAVALACGAVVFWSDDRRPVATFLFGAERDAVAPFDEVPTFDPMVLRLDMPFDGYVYVASFDYQRGTVSYFPSDFLGTDHKRDDDRMNFFTAGTHELPGPWDGKDQAWFVPAVEGALSLCVVVSPTVLTDLESALLMTRQVGNTAFPNRAMGDYMPRAGRDKRVGQRKMPHDALHAAQNQIDAIHAGPMVPWKGHETVFIKVLNVRPSKARPGAAAPSNPLTKQLKAIEKGTPVKSAPKKK